MPMPLLRFRFPAGATAAPAAPGGGGTFQDTFNRADSRAGLGTSSDGTKTWTLTPPNADFGGADSQTDGWEIKSNGAGINYIEGAMFATVDLGATTGRFKATLRALANGASAGDPFYLVAQYTNASNHLRLEVDQANGTMAVYRVAAGTPTLVVTAVSVTPGAGDSFELEALIDHSVKMYRNGSQVGTTGTDPAPSSATLWGMGHGGGVEGDPWATVIEQVDWS